MNKLKITDEKFSEIVKQSINYSQILNKCGLVVAGGNYKTIRNRIDKLCLSVTHFTSTPSTKGKTLGPKRLLEVYLENKYPIHSDRLRRRLLCENVKKHQCEMCKLTEWFNKPIPLELHHIDGNHNNNNLNNIQLLCPNCHSLTNTYRGRKKKLSPNKPKSSLKEKPTNEPKKCIACGISVSNTSKYCKQCYTTTGKRSIDAYKSQSKRCKIKWPSTIELLNMVNNSSYLQVGKELGVSDNAIRKRIRNHPI